MTDRYQKAASRRKLIYFGIIIALFVVTIFVRGLVAAPLSGLDRTIQPLTIAKQAEQLEMTERSQGEVELTGSAVRLLLTGSRGLVVCGLWIGAQEKQIKQEWNELDRYVGIITKLQPHFVTPWLFQSWNLAYNVSVEMDSLTDMYFYIARGISLLSEGETINKNNPDIRYSIAFYYQNKFGVSDKVTTLRCLLELSCIPPGERQVSELVRGKQIQSAAFEEFCRKHPRLIRRMKELPIKVGKRKDGTDELQYLCDRREDVIRFLSRNADIPSRYKDLKELKESRLQQFPVLPPSFPGGEAELNPNQRIYDAEADAHLIARGWFTYANEAVPPPNPEPAPAPRNYIDPERKRKVPSRPMLIIFVQGPPRAQTYVAEWLQKEGWFDKDLWNIDEGVTTDSARWFKSGDSMLRPEATSELAWTMASDMWERHGRAHGLLLTEERKLAYRNKAARYAASRGVRPEDDPPPPRPADLEDPEMAESYRAMETMRYYRQNLQVTQYEVFYYTSLVEQQPRTVELRKRMYQAERIYRLTQDRTRAVKLYESAFTAWKKLLYEEKRYRASDRIQEETYEYQIRYQRIIRDLEKVRLVSDTQKILASVAPIMTPVVQTWNTIEPLWFDGPFDGVDSDGKPWISESIKQRVKQNSGLRQLQQQPQAPPQQQRPTGEPA